MTGTTKQLAEKVGFTQPEMSMFISILRKKNPDSVKVVGSGPKPKRGRSAIIYNVDSKISFDLT